jgi:hypothetical protein
MEMRIEYMSEGMKITHPSGVVCVHSKENIQQHILYCEQRIMELNADIARMQGHVAGVDLAISGQVRK